MEFQAIVLAGGKGTRMNDLISRSTPKCLLPIGNRPMIYYPVRMLEMAGFREVIILTSESIKSRIKEELVLKHGIQCNLVIVGIDDTKEELDDLGTAESLRFLKEKLISDCMIVSCDLISSVNIQKMANFYRANDAAFVMLLSDISDQNYIEQSSLIGSKGKYASEKDVVGYDPATNRLLHFRAKTDVEDDGGIKLKKSILNRYPSIAWTIRLQDAHFYIIKKWLIDFVIDNPNIFSLKGDLLSFITRKQFSTNHNNVRSSNQQQEQQQSTDKKPQSQKGKSSKSAATQRPKIFDYIKAEEMSGLVSRSSSSKYFQDLFGCYAFMQFDGFCLRANNFSVYAEANRVCMSKLNQYYQPPSATTTSTVGNYDKTQISPDSLVGENLSLGDKAIVKRSVIGRNCTIGEKVKIANSILMDGCTVEESASITGCIVCSNAKITAKTELKDCFIGYSQEIASGKHSNETIKEVVNFIEVD